MTEAAQKFGNETERVARLPAHEKIYRELRGLVLYGDLAPGQAVTINGLAATLEAGVTPVREAIRRMISGGALEFQGNRRVSVPVLSAAHVGELILARQWLDPHLTACATRRASGDDVAHLEAVDAELDRAIEQGDLRAYLRLNYRFHRAIYDLADSPILAEMADGLWLRFGPSLRVVCGRIGTQNLPDKHKDALAAMRRGDADAAANAITEDVIQGMEQVRQSFETGA